MALDKRIAERCRELGEKVGLFFQKFRMCGLSPTVDDLLMTLGNDFLEIRRMCNDPQQSYTPYVLIYNSACNTTRRSFS